VRVLIDTHVWLWALAANPRLRRDARDLIQDPDNEVLLSVASAWEIGIKAAKGKLDLPAPAELRSGGDRHQPHQHPRDHVAPRAAIRGIATTPQ
jgi:PIN domain nuclease of toxin-antitoxin system